MWWCTDGRATNKGAGVKECLDVATERLGFIIVTTEIEALLLYQIVK